VLAGSATTIGSGVSGNRCDRANRSERAAISVRHFDDGARRFEARMAMVTNVLSSRPHRRRCFRYVMIPFSETVLESPFPSALRPALNGQCR
jgi:hypothetical protein